MKNGKESAKIRVVTCLHHHPQWAIIYQTFVIDTLLKNTGSNNAFVDSLPERKWPLTRNKTKWVWIILIRIEIFGVFSQFRLCSWNWFSLSEPFRPIFFLLFWAFVVIWFIAWLDASTSLWWLCFIASWPKVGREVTKKNCEENTFLSDSKKSSPSSGNGLLAIGTWTSPFSDLSRSWSITFTSQLKHSRSTSTIPSCFLSFIDAFPWFQCAGPLELFDDYPTSVRSRPMSHDPWTRNFGRLVFFSSYISPSPQDTPCLVLDVISLYVKLGKELTKISAKNEISLVYIHHVSKSSNHWHLLAGVEMSQVRRHVDIKGDWCRRDAFRC